MYARSAAFDAALINSHTLVFQADVLLNGVIVPNGANLPIKSGSVSVDGSAAVRRRGDFTVLDPDGTITPNDPTDALSPYGRELRVKRGIKFADGSTELLTVATLRIATATASNTGNGRSIAVSAFDRSRTISRYRFEVPYVIPAGTNYVTAISDLLQSRLPGVPVSMPTTTRVTPLIVLDQGGDPWAEAQKMATAIGATLYFDPSGVATLAYVPDPAALAQVWDYGAGSLATVMSVDNSFSDDPGYNGVVVDGEPPGLPPVHAVKYDTEPTSPTFSGGAYGKVPYFLRTQLITTLAQANDAAAALLIANRGGTEQVKFTGIPHPALEIGDMVRVADPKQGVDGQYLLDSFTIPFDLTLMPATTRKRRTT